MTKLVKSVKCRWANHHKKDFKPGDLEVTFVLPIGTECEIIEKKRIVTYLSTKEYWDNVLISYKNPLSGATSRALVPCEYVEEG